jgi:hypothetical protein
MASIRQVDSPAQTGPGIPDEALGPGEDASFEAELERAERRLRQTREHPMFGVHPDGLGPTLGQDVSRPNPGRDMDWNDWGYDPPT